MGLALIALAAPVFAQSDGTIDTRAAIEKRIAELEGMIGGDASAEKQAVTLRWLAELYVAAGRIDAAEAAYERILVFYPYDVASSNAFAAFLLDQRKDPERALEVTRAAIAWANSAPSPPPYLGRTYAIRARAFADAGQCADALRVAEEAERRADEDAAEDAVRTRVRCLSETGRHKEAKAALLELIGETGASNPDDQSALVAMLTRDKKRVDASEVGRMTDAAVRDARTRRAQTLAGENAELIELESSGRVRLEATLRPGQGPSAILFVPDLDSRRSAYTPYAQLFALDGITTLTVDLRGQGDSRCDSLPASDRLPPQHAAELPSDVAAAYAYLTERRKIDPSRIAVVAAGGACVVVERAIHEHNLAPVVVYLSPVFPDDDRELASAFSFRPPRPAFALASEEDIYATRSLRAFKATLDPAPVTTKIYQSAGHGVSLLREPAHFADVDAWTKDALASGASESRQ
ncbi:MAG TPA: alpha/beta fold hydrolase [Candidatus Krumholzibacteria bacterium]|nr:alpha/beta fold hydrolase [Candidatus Krumholzibacteria bacterium]